MQVLGVILFLLAAAIDFFCIQPYNIIIETLLTDPLLSESSTIRPHTHSPNSI